MFCKHKWNILTEQTTKSKYEIGVKNGFRFSEINDLLLVRRHIQIINCTVCGKIKRYVTDL